MVQDHCIIQGQQISAQSEDSQDSIDSMRNRETMSWRPSYRRILNDLLSNAPPDPRAQEEKDLSAATPTPVPTPMYQPSSGQYIELTQGGAIQLANSGTNQVQSLETLTKTNTAAAAQPGAMILQYAQTRNGQQILVPANPMVVQATPGGVQPYQLRTAPAGSMAHGMIMASTPALLTQGATKEVTRKQEVRLIKNREAARECRRKKKEYIQYLQTRVTTLEHQNKLIAEEIQAIKALNKKKPE
ncbi:cyclic AMP-responsive element-binding protein 1-like isoform X2 [Solea solea]|uniref:cyclic AMP-responsive element-binding protein 1-like isoform X2 n=1 Tax=Solea solea TaxID=90069 RepID=UPI00272C782C|nr:cyclic AMP-responsive element-binding protein 1-like isoform X2 [Solea solea]